MSLPTGSMLSKYRIASLIGKGGMGEVYAAEDTRLGRKVAIKVLPASLTDDPNRLRRFVTEAKAASALNHPSILTIYDVEEIDGRPLLVTELIEGRTLRDRLSAGGLTLRESLDIAVQIANALAAAHGAGIAHRDVKPENIMLRDDGLAKLVDFGLAKLATADVTSGTDETKAAAMPETRPGVVMGTTHYMSPEQARGVQIDARSDIFSLGVVLYEMVAGRWPFHGETASDVVAAILKEDPPPIEDLPAELHNILEKALEKERDDRYQSAKDFAVDLRRLRKHLDGASASAAATTPGHGSPQSAATTKSAQAAATSGSLPRATAWKWWLVPPVVFALGIVTFFILTSRDRTAPSPPSSASGPAMEQLKGLGTVESVAMSPDGKILGYVTSEAGRWSLSIRQMATGSAVKITEPSDRLITNLQFGPDGNFIYYAERGPTTPFRWSLMSIAAFGGTPQQVLEGQFGRISFSPDGKRFVAVQTIDRYSKLMVFDADGGHPKELGSRTAPNSYYTAAWSRSGNRLAVTTHEHNEEGQVVFRIALASLSGEPERPLTLSGLSLRQMLRLAWADGSELIVSGRITSLRAPAQLFRVNVEDGQLRPLTNDLNDYPDFVVSAETGTIATVRREWLGSIWVAPAERPDEATEVPSRLDVRDGRAGISWVSNRRLAFIRDTDFPSAWAMDLDGANPRRLSQGAIAENPATTPDGQQILFTSDRLNPGVPEVFAVPATSGPTRLIRRQNGGAVDPSISRDGRMVVFRSNSLIPHKVYKAPIDGGQAITVFEAPIVTRAQLSPDGRWIAVLSSASPVAPQTLSVVPFDGGAPRERLTGLTGALDVSWFPDGRSIVYTMTQAGISNLWRVEIDGVAPPRQMTHLTRASASKPAFSPDGKLIAYHRGQETKDIVLLKNVATSSR